MKIKTDEWDNFITYHDLSGVVERVEPTGFDAWLRFNGKASSITQFHQLRIGNKSSTSPNKIGDQIDKSTMLMKPPMISARRLESWQNTLRNSTEFDTLDHLLSLDDIGDKHPATDHADSSNNNKTIDSRDDNTTVPSGDDESPKKRQRTLSSSETNTVSPDKNTSVSEFPILTKLLGGIIDCNNKDTLGKVNEVALEIIQLLGNGTELTVRHQSNNKEVHYIKVPQNTSDASFKRRGKEWIERVLEVNGGEDDDRDDASRRLAEYLIRNHKSSVLAALHNTDTISICKPMSAIKFASMCQKAKIDTNSQKVVSKHLRDHLGKAFTQLPT